MRGALGVGTGDPSGVGCMMTFPSRAPIVLSPGLRRTLATLSAHGASGFRLHFGLPRASFEADAVLGPDSRLLHASRPEAEDERGALAGLVARRALRREDPSRAIELWKALVRGEWTLVDHVDSDSKRLLLARRNRPDVRDHGALTARECQVATYAALGHSLKFIGYELGLSSATVSFHLKRALRKLGLRHRSELARVFRARTG